MAYNRSGRTITLGPVLRPYRESDLEELLGVWYSASRAAHSFLGEDFLAREREEIRDRWIPIAETMVYLEGGRVVGFISLIGNEVGAIFVDPGHHGQGVGTTLMNWARDARPYLELDVFEANSIGRRFYERYGFEQVGAGIHEGSGEKELRLRLG